MFFSQVIGQQDLKQKIIYLINEGKLPHAINLLGNEGTGNLAMALAMTQYLHCKQKTEIDSCGTCSSCVKMKKMQHPDVHFSFPVVSTLKSIPTSKQFISEFREFAIQTPYGNDVDWIEFLGQEKQGNITALECREIIQKLQLRSFESEYKILIMWYPEYLGKEGNILLKLIEEPTAKTILIFVTEQLDELLLTIQSRTQLFSLKRLSNLEIKDALIDRGIEEEKALQIARIAEGNYNEALKLSRTQDEAFLDITRNWLNYMYSNNGLQLVNWVVEIAEKNKEVQKKFLNYFIQLIEHTLRWKHNQTQHLTLIEAEQKLIETLIKIGVDENKIPAINTILNDAIYHIERNANTKILFHNVSLHIQQILNRK